MPTKSQINTKEETTSTQRLKSPQTQHPETAPAHDVTPAVALRRSISLLPHVPRPADMLVLQRTVGNRVVSRLIQAKRKVGPEGDTYEWEAELRMKPVMQRVGVGGAEGFVLDDETAGRINRARGGGQPLEGAVQKQMSAGLGYDFSGVRVHTGQEADELNQQLQAKAFTTGPDIFFKRGAYDPASTRGRELIAHELSHVVQQGTGRVSGGGSGMTVRPASDAFEQEADALARQATGVSREVGYQESQGGIQRQEAIKPRQKDDILRNSSSLVQTRPWEGPADYYYDEADEALQMKASGTTTTSSVRSASREGAKHRRSSTTAYIQQAQETRTTDHVVQRARVRLGPLAKKGGGWHNNWYRKDVTESNRGRSIDSHPKRHGRFHAHIEFDTEQAGGVRDIGWGKTGNPNYNYHPNQHPNAFSDNTGRQYENDANYNALDDAATWQAVTQTLTAWRGRGYSLFNRNCQHFAAEVVRQARGD